MAQFNDNQFYQYPPFNPIIPGPVWDKDAEYAIPVVSSVGNGPKGDSGEINSVEATVDDGIGTPSVDVTTSGDKSNIDISFAFHNLKGDATEAIADAEAAAALANAAATTATSKAALADDAAGVALASAATARSDAADAQAMARLAKTAAENADEKALAAWNAKQAADLAAQGADQAVAAAQAQLEEQAQEFEAAQTGRTNTFNSTLTSMGNSFGGMMSSLDSSFSSKLSEWGNTFSGRIAGYDSRFNDIESQAGFVTTAANNAAMAADTAATNANIKADLADNAATAANTAATNATNAAQLATEAATDFPVLVGEVTTAQTVDDAWPTTPRGAELYGKSVQDGTPTPDSPVPVQVVGGRNLIDLLGTTAQKSGGADLIDGVITMPPISAGAQVYVIPFTAEVGAYTVSFDVVATVDNTKIRMDGQPDSTQAGGLGADRIITAGTQKQRITISDNLSGGLEGWRFYRVAADDNSSTATVYIDNLQFEAGTHATPYTPYGSIGLQVGETVIPIDLQGNTLAGGDVLKVDSAGRVWIENDVLEITLDGVNIKASAINQSYHTVTIKPIPYQGVVYAGTIVQPIYSDKLPSESRVNLNAGNEGIAIGADGDTLYAYIGAMSEFTTASQANAWLASNPITVLYPLATPQTIELGTITLPELAETCELAIYASLDPEWAITYEQNPTIVVRKLQANLANVEGATASTNYAVGAYLVRNGALYRVTRAIATGEAITPGTNVTQTTVMAEVVRLTA